MATRPRVLFLGKLYAGHRTRFLNLRAHTLADPRIRPRYAAVTGWVEGGALERLPLLPAGMKGRVRALIEGSACLRAPSPDAIWISAGEAVAPFLPFRIGRDRVPLVYDLDWTVEQQEAWAPIYFGRAGKTGLRLALARRQERALWRGVALFTPWSNWAADSLRRQGVEDARIRVLPPGVDLERWKPAPRPPSVDGPLRLLFVGGDFERKGGPLLVDIVGRRFAGRCELDVVTRDAVPATPGVRVHRAEPNSPLLRQLYAEADLFVLPSRAECFGIATVEALASGLPAIVGDVGGARDIVDEGETGWLIEPEGRALEAALERAIERRAALPAMGRRGRAVAEDRFDGARNDARVVDLILDLVRRRAGPA